MRNQEWDIGNIWAHQTQDDHKQNKATHHNKENKTDKQHGSQQKPGMNHGARAG